MGFSCGIVGLPNVGKSTIFNAITEQVAQASNFPFCTIDPNVAVVDVQDSRLDDIVENYHPKSTVPTTLEMIDIAGLVKGASEGEGLGNKFLAHIRAVDAIAHVIRCFPDPDVVHVDGDIDPKRDAEVIQTELILSDIEIIEKRLDKMRKAAKAGDKKAIKLTECLGPIKEKLDQGIPLRLQGLDPELFEDLKDFQLITHKPMFYVANLSEEDLKTGEGEAYQATKELAEAEGVPIVGISGKIEAEIVTLAKLARLFHLLFGTTVHQVLIAEYFCLDKTF